MERVFNKEIEMEELISVIVPVYNVEKYLRKCIDSIINQTYTNLEIILVDDGSPDNCGKICDEYSKKDNRIKVIHKENGGLSDARNVGIKSAKGKYITLIDSDDYVTKDYVEFLYQLIKKYNAKVSVCKHIVKYEKSGKRFDTGTGKEYNLTPVDAFKLMLYGNDMDVSAWAKMYDKELFENIEYPKGRLFEDSATTYKLFDLCENIAFKSEAKYIYIIRENSITTNGFNSKKMDLIISTNEMCNYLIEKYPELKHAADRRLMYAYLSTLTQLSKSSKKKTEKYNEYRDELMEYINKNRKEILKDNLIPKRDRLALKCTKFGYEVFKFMWAIYSIIR